MQGTTRRKITVARNGAVSGSVWENRMKIDEVKGGIKVFNGGKSDKDGDDNDSSVDEEGTRVYQRLRRNQSDSIVPGKKKRRNWTPPADEVSVDKSPIALRKARSEITRNSPRLRAMKSLEFSEGKKPVLMITDGCEGGGIEGDESRFDDKEIDPSTNSAEEEKLVNETDEISEDEDELNSATVSSEDVEKQRNPAVVSSQDVEKEQNSASVAPVQKIQSPVIVSAVKAVEKKQNSVILSPILVEKIQNPAIVSSVSIEKKLNHVIASPVTVEKKLNSVISSSVSVEKRQNPVLGPAGNADKNQIPRISRRRPDLDSPELQPSSQVPEQMFPDSTYECHNRMQTIVDLVMWREVSRSAFVFGFGSFILVSSSYTKDINFSLISATSYVGLLYLALIFTYKSILRRGECDEEYDESDERYMVGEEEAVWLVRRVLPYFNEMLVSIKALFSGDPATTMKLAVLLFVLARCGNSITVWSLIKLVFFGVFTIPRVCSSYSYQLAKYGKFWLNRLRDGWESCSHKKAVAAGIFTIIWNISSTVARIWALFMVVVAFKLYQQCVGEGWTNEEEEELEVEMRVEESKPVNIIGLHHRQRETTRAGVGQQRKVKKWL